MASYSTLLHALSTLPSTIHNTFNFLVAAIMTITPSVLVALAYRTSVMLAAARIIPAIRESGAQVLAESPEDVVIDEDDEATRILSFLGGFAPSILVAVYTSLLMQHFSNAGANGNGTTVDAEWWSVQGGGTGGNLWRWINVACTMAIYAVELYLGRGDGEGGMVGHWKTD
jgi:ICE2